MRTTYTNKILIRRKEGNLVEWDMLSDQEKKEIGTQINKQGMLGAGFREEKSEQKV